MSSEPTFAMHARVGLVPLAYHMRGLHTGRLTRHNDLDSRGLKLIRAIYYFISIHS